MPKGKISMGKKSPAKPAYPIGKRRMSGAEASSRNEKINKVVGMYNARIGKPGGPSAGKPGRVPGKDPIAGAFVGVDKNSPSVQGIGMARSIYDGVTGAKLDPRTLLTKKAKPATKSAKGRSLNGPKISRSGDTMSGYNYGTKQGPGFTGGSPYREPQDTEVSGSSIRPQLDKMSISGSTTNLRANEGFGGVYTVSRSRGKYRDGSGTLRFSDPNWVSEKVNADYAYNKGLQNLDAAQEKARITRNNQKRKGGK